MTLYRQLSKLIGLQFLILVASPFFGINFIDAVLKFWVSLPLAWHVLAYLNNGIRKNSQNRLIKQLDRPSMPDALRFPSAAEMSSSFRDSSVSNSFDS